MRQYLRLLVCLVVLFLFPVVEVHGAYTVNGVASTVGCYGYSVAPDGASDSGKQFLTFSSGNLFNGSATSTSGASFSDANGQTYSPYLFIDLGQTYQLTSLTLSSVLSKYMVIGPFAVSFSSDGVTFGNLIQESAQASVVLPHTSNMSYQCSVNVAGIQARYIRIRFFVYNWRAVDIGEIALAVQTLPEQSPLTSMSSSQLQNIVNAWNANPLVDMFGQWTKEGWAGKVYNTAELQSFLYVQQGLYANVTPDANRFDSFGGDKTLGISVSPGSWRLQKINGRWWFITPAGNPYLIIGMDGVGAWNNNAVQVPGEPNIAKEYAWIPSTSDANYSSCWFSYGTGYMSFDFFAADLIRYYGTNYLSAFLNDTYRRLIYWGFNCSAKWASAPVPLPYITACDLPAQTWNYGGLADPYASNYQTTVNNTVTTLRNANSADPNWIGSCFEEETWFSNTTVSQILSAASGSPAKNAFITQLQGTYGTIAALNSVCGTNWSSWSVLPSTDLSPYTTQLASSISTFITAASNQYYGAWRTAINTYDPGRLLLGSCFVPGMVRSEWISASATYCDALMMDNYSLDPNTSLSYVQQYAVPANKPVILGEYSITTNQRGFQYYPPNIAVADQISRGQAYSTLNSALFSNPNWVGSCWYIYRDDPTLGGGPNGGGEDYNFGVVDTANLPYQDLVGAMRQTNSSLFRIHASADQIEINGLTGAQHWVWYEAEYGNSLVNIAPAGAWQTYDSGGGTANNNELYVGGVAGTASFNLPIDIPANMTNAYVYVRNNGNAGYTATVTTNSNTVGTFTTIANGFNYYNAIYWQAQTLNAGALSQGICNLGVSVTSGYTLCSFDGVFISDGPIVTSNNPLTPGLNSSYWMTPPTDAGTHIVYGPVTPQFNYPSGSTVSYYLDGVSYTPGTPISTPGAHQLYVTVYNGTQRYMVGANFTIVQIAISGLTGAQHWVWYEAEYGNSLVNIAPTGAWQTYDSGGGTANNNELYAATASDCSFNLPIVIPANMSNAYLYVRNNGNAAHTAAITINGYMAGIFTTISNGFNYYNAIYWQAQTLNLGALNQGICNLGIFVQAGGWFNGAVDGVFISDGPIVTSNSPLTPGLDSSYWMKPPTDAGTHIVYGPVTPQFNYPSGSTVSYYLDGVSYTPGTPISTPGAHQLYVTVYSGTQRYMVGANFTIAQIEISGLTGAQHWVWYEAEYGNSLVNIAPAGAWQTYDSGGGTANNNELYVGGVAGTASFNLPIDIPANMTNAYVYVRNNGNAGYTATVTTNSNTVGTFTTIANGFNYYNAIYWQAQTLNAGALSQGICNLGVSVTSGYTLCSFDGVFISDGPIVTSNSPPTPGLNSSYWMKPPTDAGTHIIHGTVMPQFNYPSGSTVSYYLDGVSYTPGTPISATGAHQLYVTVYNGTQRYMAGANFKIQ